MSQLFLRVATFFLLCHLAITSVDAQVQVERRVSPIKTAWLFPVWDGEEQRVQPSIIFLEDQPTAALRLIFDHVAVEAPDYSAKLIHCNADWKISALSSIDYLDSYNEFRINTFEASVSTKTAYTHFMFNVPPVKKSGNYILQVYRSDDDAVVLAKRFVVVERGAQLAFQRMASIGNAEGIRQQQLSLKVGYGSMALANPWEDLKAVVRQNSRWDSARLLGRPAFADQGQSELDYGLSNPDLMFDGGNEFRTIDLTGLMAGGGGMGVKRIETLDTAWQALVYIDKPRSTLSYYSGKQDMNGRFNIAVRGQNANDWEADYALTIFQLETGNVLEGEVYVTGSFCEWQQKPECRLKYIPSQGSYIGSVWLKQGLYDYIYTEKGNTYGIEGCHALTKNEYDVIIYARPFGSRADRAVGYAYLPY